MAVLTIARATIQANTIATSNSRTIPARLSAALVQLTDPDGTWPSSPDDTRHIKIWGVQLNRNDGAGFVWWLFQEVAPDANPQTTIDTPAMWTPFGQRDRHGDMPAMEASNSAFLAETGSRVRLAILTDSPIVLGATITTNA